MALISPQTHLSFAAPSRVISSSTASISNPWKSARKGSVFATKTVETQGKGSVFAAKPWKRKAMAVSSLRKQWKHKAKAVSLL